MALWRAVKSFFGGGVEQRRKKEAQENQKSTSEVTSISEPKSKPLKDLPCSRTVQDAVFDALETGEVLTIIYHGGSQSGAVREIAPVSVDDDKVRARCFSTDVVKTYILEKMELVDGKEANALPKWEAEPVQARYADLNEVCAVHNERLANLGWEIRRETDDIDDSLCLYAHFKNGKLRKTPTIKLTYQAKSWEYQIGQDGEMKTVCTGKRTRPWIVRSKNLPSSRAFGKVERAVSLFLQQADVLKA